jgi:hypothetical protein
MMAEDVLDLIENPLDPPHVPDSLWAEYLSTGQNVILCWLEAAHLKLVLVNDTRKIGEHRKPISNAGS